MSKLDKRAISTTLVIALFLLSALAMAIPFSLAAIDDQGDIVFASDGTTMPVWSTAEKIAGYYSVEADATTDRLQVVVAYGKSLSTLVALTTTIVGSPTLDVEFNVFYPTSGVAPYAVLLLDTTGNGVVDAAVVGGLDYVYGGGGCSYGSWNRAYKHASASWSIRDVDIYGVLISGTYGGPYNDEGANGFPVTLAGLDASIDFTIAGDDPTVLYIGIGVVNNPNPSYIDDIIIGGVTYTLEYYPPGEGFSIDYVTPGDVDYGDILEVKGSGVTSGSDVEVYWDTAVGTGAQLLNTTPNVGLPTIVVVRATRVDNDFP